jgi:hypothetical protein
MFPQRSILRLSQRAGQQLRRNPVRSSGQARFNSTDGKLPWMVDNEFNRERAAVKHHAAATSSKYFHESLRDDFKLGWFRISILTQWASDLWRRLSI